MKTAYDIILEALRDSYVLQRSTLNDSDLQDIADQVEYALKNRLGEELIDDHTRS